MSNNSGFNYIMRWVTFIPIQIILYYLIILFLQLIPVVWVLRRVFDFRHADPLKTEHVSGPIGFTLVYLMSLVALTFSSKFAIRITPKPRLAWKIIWSVQLFPYLLYVIGYAATGVNGFSGNLWFNLASFSALLTAIFISYRSLSEGDVIGNEII